MTQLRGEKRKAAIADVAGGLFFRRGFEHVSVDDVAEHAHASKQTIYRHFGDRAGLIAAVLRTQLEIAIGPLEEAARVSGEPFEVLRDVGAAYQQMAFDKDFLRIYRFLIGSVNHDPILGQIFNELVTDRVTACVGPVLTAAMGGQPSDVATDAFLGALQGKEFNRALAGALARPHRIARLLDVTLASVRSQVTPESAQRRTRRK